MAKTENPNPIESEEAPPTGETPLIESAGNEYLDDVTRMLTYCRDQGIRIPDALESKVAHIYSLTAEPMLDVENFNAVVKTHGQLCSIIAPATPLSLAATEFFPYNERSRTTFYLLLALFVVALVGMLGYIATELYLNLDQQPGQTVSAKQEVGASEGESSDPNTAVSATGDSQLRIPVCTQLSYLCAAVIGASFSGLLAAYRYLRNRSFDPHYLPIYIIRFVVGVLAGVILASFCSELFSDGKTIPRFGPGLIALLGGYSAEAVRQILDRLVEVLVTVVRGKDTAAKERLSVAKEVLAVSQDIGTDPNTPAHVREKLDALLKKLQS